MSKNRNEFANRTMIHWTSSTRNKFVYKFCFQTTTGFLDGYRHWKFYTLKRYWISVPTMNARDLDPCLINMLIMFFFTKKLS